MPVAANKLAPSRQRVLTFLSPNVQDILFVETVDAQRVGAEIPPYGTPHPDTKRWPDHELVYVKTADEQGQLYQYYYAAKREAQDNYNFQYGSVSMGGLSMPVVERLYIIPREEFDSETPLAGAAMPTGPNGKFDGLGYILMDREQQDADEVLRSLFVIEKRTYIQRYTSNTIGVDDLNGKTLYKTTEVFYATEVVAPTTLTAQALFAAPTNAYWGLQADGFKRTGQRISDEWFVVEREQVVSGTFSGGAITIHSYLTTEDYVWPAVLGGITPRPYDLKGGGTEYYVEPYLAKEAYRGPCKANVLVMWAPTPFTVSQPEVMQPLPISVTSPFYSFSVGPTLHPQGKVDVLITNHPRYESVAGNVGAWESTSPVDWPPSIIASDEQKPFRGGWLRTKVTIYQPVAPQTPP